MNRSKAAYSGSAIEPTSRWNVSRSTPTLTRYTPSRARFDGAPSSCSSVQTTVAKFGQCFSSRLKKAALSRVATTASGNSSRISWSIVSRSGPSGSASAVMNRAYDMHVNRMLDSTYRYTYSATYRGQTATELGDTMHT